MAINNYVDLPESTGSGGGVTSLNSLTGALTLVGGTGITVTPSGSNITISATGSGSVTSVALADASTSPIYAVSGSPVTSSGTLTLTLQTQSANLVFAGPSSGSAAQPTFRALVSSDLPTSVQVSTIGITIDGGGSTPTTGQKGFVYIPYACTINSVTMMADVAGSAVVDLWVSSYASFPPTIANTITASDLPTLSSQQNSQDTTLTGWTKTIAAGSVMAFNLNSASTLTRINLNLKVTRT